MEPDYGYEYVGFEESQDPDNEYPLTVTLRRSAGPNVGEEYKVRTKYLVGADGARSNVRKSLGYRLRGDQPNHAWGVMDVFADTDFPDVRKKCTIKSAIGRNMLLVLRERGFVHRLYMEPREDLEDNGGAIPNTPVEDSIAQANEISHR